MNRAWLALPLFLAVAACGKGDPDFNRAPGVGETESERSASISEAFREPASENAASDATLAEMQKIFNELTAAGNASNPTAALQLISIEYMSSAAIAQSKVSFTPAEKRRFVNESRQSVRTSWFRKGDGTFDWKKSVVVKAGTSDDGKFALAFVRHHLDDYGTIDKARWWLIRENDKWLIYDWEYATTSIRVSSDWGRSIVASQAANPPKWVDANHLSDARVHMANEDYEAATRVLEEGFRVGYPTELEAVRLLYMSTCLCELEEYDRALVVADRAINLRPEMPETHFYRGVALFELERDEAARQEFEWYIKVLGSDSNAYSYLGELHLRAGDVEAAAKAFRDSLGDFPNATAIYGLARCIKDGQYAELASWFVKLPDPARDYPWLIAEVYNNIDSNAATTAINHAYRKINASDPELAWFTAMVQLDDGQYEEGAETLRPAIDRAKEDERALYRAEYWRAMARCGKGQDALKEAGADTSAFSEIADALFEDESGAALKEVCEFWKKGHENSTELWFYLAESEFLLGEHAAAEPHFRAGLKLAKPGEPFFDGLWHGLVDCMQHQGHWMEAYAEFQRSPDVFRYLADLLFSESKADALEQLIAKHAEANADHWYMPRHRGELAWLRKDWKEASKHLEAFYANKLAMDDPWRVLERCVRASIRAGDTSTARRRAEVGLGEVDNYLMIICHAAADQPKSAMSWATAYVEAIGKDSARHWITELYDDEDVGDKMRGEAYKSLHERFPPPERKPPDPPAEAPEED
jgi:tetratricopeptide (TPR) repeat protein